MNTDDKEKDGRTESHSDDNRDKHEDYINKEKNTYEAESDDIYNMISL